MSDGMMVMMKRGCRWDHLLCHFCPPRTGLYIPFAWPLIAPTHGKPLEMLTGWQDFVYDKTLRMSSSPSQSCWAPQILQETLRQLRWWYPDPWQVVLSMPLMMNPATQFTIDIIFSKCHGTVTYFTDVWWNMALLKIVTKDLNCKLLPGTCEELDFVPVASHVFGAWTDGSWTGGKIFVHSGVTDLLDPSLKPMWCTTEDPNTINSGPIFTCL